MPVDITKFAVAVQGWFMRGGGCNIIDFTTVLECNKNSNSEYYNNSNKYTNPYCVSVTVCPF
jgi:hypothetical protein